MRATYAVSVAALFALAWGSRAAAEDAAEAVPPSTETTTRGGIVGSLVDSMTTQRFDRTGGVASGFLKPLPQPLAIAAAVVGLFLMLFGEKFFRAGMVLYMAALFGFAGSVVGGFALGENGPLVGGIAGLVAGAILAIPLRSLLGALIGGLAGAVLAVVAVQSFPAGWGLGAACVLAGTVGSAVLTFLFPKTLLSVGFALFGAAVASVGVLSLFTEPDPVSERLVYTGARVAGVLLAAALGAAFRLLVLKRRKPSEGASGERK